MSKLTCIVCGIPKDPKEFYDSPSAKSGISGKCKECAGEYSKEYVGGRQTPGNRNYHKSNKVRNDNFIVDCF